MNENVEEKAIKEKKTKKLKSRVKKRTTELLTFYKSAGKDMLNTYRSLIEHLAFIDVMIQEYQDDILENGCYVKYQNGKNQSGIRKNDSVDLFKKWYSERLSDSERLKKLLSLEDEEIDDGFDDFINS